jgi:hypothetical protein
VGTLSTVRSLKVSDSLNSSLFCWDHTQEGVLELELGHGVLLLLYHAGSVSVQTACWALAVQVRKGSRASSGMATLS